MGTVGSRACSCAPLTLSPLSFGELYRRALSSASAAALAPQGLVWGSCSQAVASCAAALAYACVGSHSTANAIPRSPNAYLDLDPT